MEKVAAVATEEPQIAAKPPQAAIVAMPSPPRRWPRNALAARNSSRLMPDVVAKAPISRNSGTTAKLKSVTVRIVVWPTIFSAGTPEVR